MILSLIISFDFAAKLRKNRRRTIFLLILFEYFNRFVPKIARFLFWGGIICEKTGWIDVYSAIISQVVFIFL